MFCNFDVWLIIINNQPKAILSFLTYHYLENYFLNINTNN